MTESARGSLYLCGLRFAMVRNGSNALVIAHYCPSQRSWGHYFVFMRIYDSFDQGRLHIALNAGGDPEHDVFTAEYGRV